MAMCEIALRGFGGTAGPIFFILGLGGGSGGTGDRLPILRVVVDEGVEEFVEEFEGSLIE